MVSGYVFAADFGDIPAAQQAHTPLNFGAQQIKRPDYAGLPAGSETVQIGPAD